MELFCLRTIHFVKCRKPNNWMTLQRTQRFSGINPDDIDSEDIERHQLQYYKYLNLALEFSVYK